MTISKVVFLLVVIFGSSSWMGTNSVWMQLPLLTTDLPEGWGLPSYLAAVVQIACIGPLIYTILHKGCSSFTIPTVPLIISFLLLACVCQLGLVFFWNTTAWLGEKRYSVVLYILLFGLALVNAISNVLFMPFMSQFHHAYLNAYFIGMGFSALVPSLLSIVQGTTNYECNGNSPHYFPPRFSVSVFFFIVFIWTCLATVCFIILYREGAHKSDDANENTPLNGSISIPAAVQPLEIEDPRNPIKETAQSGSVLHPSSSYVTGTSYIFVLVATALVNAQMNGVIPSIQSYAALPYSQATYHYGLTFSNIISPLASFLPFFISIRSNYLLAVLTVLSSCFTAFIIYLASLSPDLIFNSSAGGSALSIISVLIAAGLHSYLRIVFASLLREGHQSESRLFWCGVFIQIGSFIGSAVMFPLVNVMNVFTPSPPCRSV